MACRTGDTAPRPGRTPRPVALAWCRRWWSGWSGTCSATTCRGPAAPPAADPSPHPPASSAGARRRSTARCCTRFRRLPSPAGRAAPRRAAGPDRRPGWRPRCADPSRGPSRSGPRWATASSSSARSRISSTPRSIPAACTSPASRMMRMRWPARLGRVVLLTRQLPSIFRCEWMLAAPTRMNRCLPRLTTSSTRCPVRSTVA